MCERKKCLDSIEINVKSYKVQIDTNRNVFKNIK